MAEQSKPHTADRLRHDIDKGAAGDKKGFPDTSASPLGTDDEAAGTPNTDEQVAEAQAAETSRPDGPAASGLNRPVSVNHGSENAETSNRSILIMVTVGVAVVLTLIAVLV